MEGGHPVGLETSHHLIQEPLAGGVHNAHAGEAIHESASNGMHQMSLAHPDAAVDKERVVASGRKRGNRSSGRVGELIAGSDNEVIKLEPRIQLPGNRSKDGFGRYT